jgi:hypothetical protein
MALQGDSQLRIATCSKCGAPVFACDSDGFRVALDPQDCREGWPVSELMKKLAGLATYDVVNRYASLRVAELMTTQPQSAILAQHPCRANVIDVRVQILPKQRAVTHLSREGNYYTVPCRGCGNPCYTVDMFRKASCSYGCFHGRSAKDVQVHPPKVKLSGTRRARPVRPPERSCCGRPLQGGDLLAVMMLGTIAGTLPQTSCGQPCRTPGPDTPAPGLIDRHRGQPGVKEWIQEVRFMLNN